MSKHFDFNKNRFLKIKPTKVIGGKILRQENAFERTKRILEQQNQIHPAIKPLTPEEKRRNLIEQQKNNFFSCHQTFHKK